MKENKKKIGISEIPEDWQIFCHSDNIKQDLLDYQAEQQKAYDDFVEWYQTVGYLEEEQGE